MDLTILALSKPLLIANSSEASTLRVTRLLFVELQWIILADPDWSERVVTKPIWLERSRLFAKEASIKQVNCKGSCSLTKRRARSGWSFCLLICLLRSFISLTVGTVACAAYA